MVVYIFPLLAYHAVSQSYGLDDQASSGDDSDASDLEVMDVSLYECICGIAVGVGWKADICQ